MSDQQTWPPQSPCDQTVATVARYHDTFRNSDGTWTLARRSMEFTG